MPGSIQLADLGERRRSGKAPEGTPGAPEPTRQSADTTSWGSQSSARLSIHLSDARVLRGTGVSEVLSGFGQYLRERTGLASATFTPEESVDLWCKSWQVEEINEFVSHCWGDAGLSKAVAMHLYYNGEAAALAAVLVGLTFVVFRWVGWLPAFVLRDYFGPGVHMHYAPWSLLTGSLAFFVTLALGHRITDNALLRRGMRRPTLFFDKICVHQSDAELKRTGVSNFAAIVGKSRRMLLLWTPSYFTRLWCTLECATLVRIAKRDQSGKIQLPRVFYPVSIASNTVMRSCIVLFCCLVYCCGKVPALHRFRLMNTAIMVAVLAVTSPVYMHSLRRYMRQRMLLSRQMEQFSVNNAGCVMESDREMICHTLDEWFGTAEAFDRVVQTTVRRHVVEAIGSEARVSFRAIALGFVPFLCHQMDFIPIYASLGGWRGFMMMLSLPSYLLWGIAQCQQMHHIAWRVARKRRLHAADVAVSGAAALAWMCMVVVQLAPLASLVFIPDRSALWYTARASTFVFFAVLVAKQHFESR